MDIFIAVLITLWLLAAIFLYIAFVIFSKTFSRAKDIAKIENKFYKRLEKSGKSGYVNRIEKSKKSIYELEHEPVEIFSTDELTLRGKLFLAKGENAQKTVLLCHGLKSYGEFDFGTAFSVYQKLGYNVLIVDQRAHAKSEGRHTTLGIMESYDIVSWCQWLELRFGTGCGVIIHGISMGAFAAALACENPEMPKNAEKLILDSVYKSVYSVVNRQIKKALGPLSMPMTAGVNMFCRLNAGFDMRDADLLNHSKKIKIPAMFIHSRVDDIAPFEDMQEISAALNSKTKIVLLKHAQHGLSFVADKNECCKELENFLNQH